MIIGVILVFLLAGCTKQEQKIKPDGERFKEEYESLNGKENTYEKEYRSLKLDKENPIIYKSPKEIIQMMDEKETFVIYFGFASCPWCRSVIPSLLEVAQDLGITEIYYVDVSKIRDTLKIEENGSIITEKEGTDDYYILLEKLDSVLEEYTLTDKENNTVSTGKKRIYAPNIISIIDGIPTELTDGISENQADAYMELSDKILEESYDKIKCSIQCIADSREVCSAKTKC